MRWIAQLSDYHLIMHFRSGKLNANADALSRQHTYLPVNLRALGVKARIPDIPEDSISLDDSEIAVLQSEDSDLACVAIAVRQRSNIASSWTKAAKTLWRERERLEVISGVLYRRKEIEGSFQRQLVIPKSLQACVLYELHEGLGHQGIQRTWSLISDRFYWVGMWEAVCVYCRSCKRCGLNKAARAKPEMGTLRTLRPLEVIAIDFTTVEKSDKGIENILVITDVFTKLSHAIPTRNQTAKCVATVLKNTWFDRFGLPRRIHSDQGRNFESAIIRELCEEHSIIKSRTTTYHPQGNGMVKRINRTLHNLLWTLSEEEKKAWPDHIATVLYAYNCTPHATTGYSLYYMFFG